MFEKPGLQSEMAITLLRKTPQLHPNQVRSPVLPALLRAILIDISDRLQNELFLEHGVRQTPADHVSYMVQLAVKDQLVQFRDRYTGRLLGLLRRIFEETSKTSSRGLLLDALRAGLLLTERQLLHQHRTVSNELFVTLLPHFDTVIQGTDIDVDSKRDLLERLRPLTLRSLIQRDQTIATPSLQRLTAGLLRCYAADPQANRSDLEEALAVAGLAHVVSELDTDPTFEDAVISGLRLGGVLDFHAFSDPLLRLSEKRPGGLVSINMSTRFHPYVTAVGHEIDRLPKEQIPGTPPVAFQPHHPSAVVRRLGMFSWHGIELDDCVTSFLKRWDTRAPSETRV